MAQVGNPDVASCAKQAADGARVVIVIDMESPLWGIPADGAYTTLLRVHHFIFGMTHAIRLL
jgi:hypothetical protein